MKRDFKKFGSSSNTLVSDGLYKRFNVGDLILRARYEEKKEKRNITILFISFIAIVVLSGLLISL